ncbi:hypothetical protein NAS2_1444 [Conexivisphaera calida]|uniref:Uncharacterized protein n=2 Tax=Conexivisphaera calida TaxID=1874277 RepID=A0A4P2VDZ7_9ARCH|nr:hypothetical protein NAS2_1444 [Conexivisphaera calida]
MYAIPQVKLEGRPPKPLKSAPDAEEGAEGWVKLLDMQLNGIVSSRVRHVIKRFLKRIGFKDVVVEHEPDRNPLMLRLVAVGYAERPVTRDQVRKVQYLRSTVDEVLREAYVRAGHSSKADPEKLRLKLAEMEPSLRKVYYAA